MEGVQTRSRTKADNLKREQSPETSHDEGDEGESESEWSYCGGSGIVDSDGNEIEFPKRRRWLLPDWDSEGNEVSESDQGGCDESDEQEGE